MSASRWDRLEVLFEAAGKMPRAERDAFVEREVGDDPDLHRELCALLDASRGAAGYMTALHQELLGLDVQEMLLAAPTLADAPDPWIGQTVSHYEILHRIGGGGMGVVYRARDIHLGRPIALKFIAPQISLDPEAKRRFLQEARAASALDHPNICTIHEIAETVDGRLFLAMAAYDGETLRNRIERGRLAEANALEIAEQIARALAAAHERGIVHRDVKPDNVFITRDGVVKLLDFGLARTGDRPISEVNVVQGTVAYMSPEQLSGHPADERSDVWALGVVLFEMLAAARPFAAPDPRAAVHLILNSEPDLRAHRSDLASGIPELVHAAMSKDPTARPANGSQFLEALRACRSGAAIPVPRRGTRRLQMLHSRTAARGLLAALAIVTTVITTRTFLPQAPTAPERNLPVGVAIVPFIDGDAGVDLAEFGRDLAERVGATLALVPDLHVIPDEPRSSFTAAASVQPERRRQLDRVVDGALHRKGESVLVSVRLLDGSTRDSLWTGSWERSGADQAALLDELSLVIADAVRLHIVPYQARTYTENRRAYDRFLQGVYAHRRYTNADIWTALQFYREAYEEDPTFALAHAIAGNAYIDLTHLGLSQEIGLEMAREHVHEALSLDSTLAEAHAALGFLQIWGDQDFESGEASLRRSIMLYPTMPQARAWYGRYALFVRDWRDAALANVRRALEVDPLNTVRSHAVEQQLYRARRYDEVLEQHRVTWSLDRDVARSLLDSPLAEAYREMGRYDESIAEFRALQERTGAPPAAGLAITYARMGRETEAREILRDVERRALEADDLALAVGRIYANLGDFDRAFQWLERAYEFRRYTLLSIGSDPALDPLRADPRFAELLRRVGLPPA